MLPIWNDVCAKNYNKSLDHRSFYFKQADKKNLSGKGMTQEIKEVSDKKKTADDTIGARMSKSPGESPDLTFEYTDRNVHDDTYAVTRFSAREIMSGEPANKVMTFYRDFLEPFFKIKRDNEDDFKDNTAERCAKVVKAAEANASPGGKKKGKKGGNHRKTRTRTKTKRRAWRRNQTKKPWTKATRKRRKKQIRMTKASRV
jgi:paired amphipathic helix protein Sin3a